MESTHERNRVKTSETTFELIESLVEQNGAGISELAELHGLAKSTVHRHLTSLKELEYVVEEEGIYHLGFRFLKLGEHTRQRDDSFELAASTVEELAEKTDERAQFIVEEHGQAVYVFREIGEHAVQTGSSVGKRIPLHATSAGKAILAHLSKDRVEYIIERRGLTAMTDNTIVGEEELYEELEEIREKGYSYNEGENIEGLHAVGAPVIYSEGSVFGALSVSAPTQRIHGDRMEEELPNLLLGAANELELKMKYS